MDELQVLLKQEIPSGKNALLESRNNLKNVAAYCAENYITSKNKKDALEETKKYTTQSLASVAYQINTLASNMLQMLDIQATQLANMESAINNISQTVDIHKEKVARREIGQLTTNKVINRAYQIIAPSNPDRPVKYVRKPMDYNELDDIGHGVKLSTQNQSNQQSGRRPSNFSGKRTASPNMNGSKRDSLHSVGSSGGYGTLRPVRAPTVPTDFKSTPTGTDFGTASTIPPPPSDFPVPPSDPLPPPISDLPPPPMNDIPPPPMESAIPPPPPMGSSLPPPPPTMAPPSVSSESSESFSVSNYDRTFPDMPPPMMNSDMLPPPPPQEISFGSNSSDVVQEPSWAPSTYVEKVVVIYDYSAENSDELSLKEDEVVYIVKKNDDGWYEGVSNGKTGLFPGNYVEGTSG